MPSDFVTQADGAEFERDPTVPALFQPDPRAVKVAAQIRAQQKILAPRGIVLDDFTIEDMAQKFVRITGLDDLRKLKASPRTTVFYGEEMRIEPTTVEQATIWEFHAQDDPEALKPFGSGFGDATSNRWEFEWHRGNRLVYNIHWSPGIGAPIFLTTPYVAVPWYRPFIPMIGFALAFTGIGAAIGQAVLGAQTAAAYPALANAVGQFAVRTVLTGGDVEAAFKSAAAGSLGAEFGDVVGSAVNSDWVGVAAGAATEAALQGEDARKAVLTSLITQGGTIVSELFPGDPTDYDPGDYVYLPEYDFDVTPDFTGDISLDDLGLSLDVDSILESLEFPEALTLPPDVVLPDEAGNFYTVDGHYVEMQPEEYLSSLYPDEAGNIRSPDNQILLTAEEGIRYLDDPVGLSNALRQKIEPLEGGTVAPLTAPNLRPLNIPPPAGATKTPIIDWAKSADQLLKVAVSIGGSIKAISNGTFRPQYNTSPFGTARPPVGVPVRQADGSTVVNNGNGTQTVRYADGRVVTMPSAYSNIGAPGTYGQSLIPGIPNTALLIGGGVVLVALLLSRR